MKTMKLISVLIIFAMAGCATVGGQSEWYTAQKEFMLAQQSLPQKPLFEMKALPGTSIQNLESLTVYIPAPTPPKELKQFVQAPHPGWGVLDTGIKTAGQVAGVALITNGVENIFGSITKMASIPTSSTTQTVSGAGNAGTIRSMGDMRTGDIGNYSTVGGQLDQTATPTVVNPVVVTTPAPEVVVVEPSYPPGP